MAAESSKPAQAPKSTTSPTSSTNATARLEKAHPGVRRSTPDSEALASSDDDGDQPQQMQPSTSVPIPKPGRRTSWLNEVPPHVTRKSSLTTTAPLSSGASNPTSPATDQSWSTSPGLGGSIPWNHVGGGSFPWGTGIWNSESRKEPPPRLSEIVPSPTMSNPSLANNFLPEEVLSPTARTSGDAGIPFSIPLHPTPKTYRSQSYSVGQLDPEFLNLMAGKSGGGAPPTARPRNSAAQMSALQRRSSRPSLLGELGHDPVALGRVREDDDDDEGSTNGSDGSMINQARTIEQLSRENALLRQAAAAGQMDNRVRDRAASTASANSGYAVGSAPHNLHRIRGSVPEEDLAVEDLDELRAIPGYSDIHSNTRRRYSEHSGNLEKQFSAISPLENRALDNVRKAHWQTSLGFGGIPEIPQSRRHSFADIPMRHTSISSAAGDSQGPVNLRAGLADREDEYPHIADGPVVNAPGQNPSYFSHEQSLRMADEASRVPNSLHPAYPMPHHPYGRHQPPLAHLHQNQLLYIVTFKCHRADVFYIQEDTGLQVKPGDLVIVEADRGTDLGTVQHANISLQKARELKQQYAEEHYKWLMMFSRQGQNGASNVFNPSESMSSLNGRSAVGGMGPHGSHGAQEVSADIKPKLIKRLAQNHEILTLRDKEGNEAKAKRVCQQKVVEHRLNMEILDSEFQMDWKKLTFYYFADSYINFNSLVTDLFKIYKTRIWMSAINPASFVTAPGAGLQSSGGLDNLGYGQEVPPNRRHPQDIRAYGNGQGMETGRDAMTNQMLLRNAYADNYQQFGQGSRQPEASLGGGFGLQAQPDPFSSYAPSMYGPMETGYVDYANSPRISPAPGDWTSRFQGLSLGS